MRPPMRRHDPHPEKVMVIARSTWSEAGLDRPSINITGAEQERVRLARSQGKEKGPVTRAFLERATRFELATLTLAK
jgi:hypothetical protein